MTTLSTLWHFVFGCESAPVGPPVEPRVYGQPAAAPATPELIRLHGEAKAESIRLGRELAAMEARAIRAERRARETWAALEREHGWHKEAADRCQQLAAEVESKEREVRVANASADQARAEARLAWRKFRRERRWHKGTEAALHAKSVELENLKRQLGLTK